MIFLFLLKNIDCGYLLASTLNLCFEQKYEKVSEFLYENFRILVVKFSIYLNRAFVVHTCRKDTFLCGTALMMLGWQQFFLNYHSLMVFSAILP